MRKSINDANDAIEIDLQKLLMRWLANWWLIMFCGIFFACASLVYTKQCITPLYKANITAYVNNIRAGNQIESISSSSLSTSKQLVQTYIKIISSDTVLNKVAEAAEVDYDANQIRGMLSAAQIDETELFKVYVSHPDPEMTARIANAIAEVIPTEIANIVEGSSTKIIDYATVPKMRYTPSYTRNTVLGGIVGGVVAVAWITILFLMDVRIKEAEDLVSQYDYPILGQIPNFDQISTRRSHKSGYGYGYDTAKISEKKEGEKNV
ncbi:MAG: hypothetical protein IKU27_08200 [Clostridia bacterium]|nr:hypothetical protein [Clostridia bacterium]